MYLEREVDMGEEIQGVVREELQQRVERCIRTPRHVHGASLLLPVVPPPQFLSGIPLLYPLHRHRCRPSSGLFARHHQRVGGRLSLSNLLAPNLLWRLMYQPWGTGDQVVAIAWWRGRRDPKQECGTTAEEMVRKGSISGLRRRSRAAHSEASHGRHFLTQALKATGHASEGRSLLICGPGCTIVHMAASRSCVRGSGFISEVLEERGVV
jgi:hypothetical protein